MIAGITEVMVVVGKITVIEAPVTTDTKQSTSQVVTMKCIIDNDMTLYLS